MNKQKLKIKVITSIIALTIVVGGSAAGLVIVSGGSDSEQAHQPEITVQPGNQMIEVGADASFSVSTGWGWSYQWLHNGLSIIGETNSLLTIEDVQTNDAGFYSCNVDTGRHIISSSAASLLAYIIVDVDPVIVVYAQPVVSSGGSGSCPGHYTGYVNYSVTGGWGWAPDPNTTVYTATDTNRTNTKVEYVGGFGDEGCNKTSVTIPYPAYSPQYMFSISFTNNVPSGSYAITLSGFLP